MEGSNAGDEYEYLYKIVIIGDSGVGKTNILTRFTSNTFHAQSKPTIGVELGTKSIKFNNNIIKAQIWDTAGQERYRAITGSYYKGSLGAMIVFDITKINSFNNVEKWLKELNQECKENVFILLVGNKTDLNSMRTVKKEDASNFAQKNNLGYIETSALECRNIEEAFNLIIAKIYDSKSSSISSRDASPNEKIKKGINIEEKVADKKAKGCCG